MTGSRSMREAVFRNLFDLKHGHPFARQLEKFVVWLIIANVLALLLERLPWHEQHQGLFGLFDEISLYFFTLEYVLRLYAAGGDPRYQGKKFASLRFAKTPLALIDLVVIAPYWLHMLGLVTLDLRALRVVRLLRLLKILRELGPSLREFNRMNAGRTLRQKADALMNDTPNSGKLHHQLDLLLMALIIIAVATAFLESVPSIQSALKTEFFWIEIISIAVFTIEYLLRLYAAPEREPDRPRGGAMLAFMKKPASIIDLLAILPYYLSFLITIDLRFLRILRILRVLKLTRYNTAFTTFAMVLNRERRAFFAAMFVTVLITILSGAIVYEVEHPVQPDKFDTMPRAMYWAVITLASVGYGDISPVTPIGQAFTMVLAILGIGIVALPAGILGSAFTDQLHQQREQMLSAVEEAFADGVLTEDEERQLESERVRLHLSNEQFEKIKQRALLRHAKEFSTTYVVVKASEEIAKLRETLQRLPVDAAVVEIDKLNLPDAEKAALRVLLK